MSIATRDAEECSKNDKNPNLGEPSHLRQQTHLGQPYHNGLPGEIRSFHIWRPFDGRTFGGQPHLKDLTLRPKHCHWPRCQHFPCTADIVNLLVSNVENDLSLFYGMPHNAVYDFEHSDIGSFQGWWSVIIILCSQWIIVGQQDLRFFLKSHCKIIFCGITVDDLNQLSLGLIPTHISNIYPEGERFKKEIRKRFFAAYTHPPTHPPFKTKKFSSCFTKSV